MIPQLDTVLEDILQVQASQRRALSDDRACISFDAGLSTDANGPFTSAENNALGGSRNQNSAGHQQAIAGHEQAERMSNEHWLCAHVLAKPVVRSEQYVGRNLDPRRPFTTI